MLLSKTSITYYIQIKKIKNNYQTWILYSQPTIPCQYQTSLEGRNALGVIIPPRMLSTCSPLSSPDDKILLVTTRVHYQSWNFEKTQKKEEEKEWKSWQW